MSKYKCKDNGKSNRRLFDCASCDETARGFAQDDDFEVGLQRSGSALGES